MPDAVTLAPSELAELLGLPREDGPGFGAASYRLDASLVESLREMRGPIALSFQQIEAIFGFKADTLWRWHKKGGLACQAAGGSSRVRLRVAPAEMIRLLRQIQADRHCSPAPTEAPGQAAKRGKGAMDRMTKRLNLRPAA